MILFLKFQDRLFFLVDSGLTFIFKPERLQMGLTMWLLRMSSNDIWRKTEQVQWKKNNPRKEKNSVKNDEMKQNFLVFRAKLLDIISDQFQR